MKLYLEITLRSGREINGDASEITESEYKEAEPTLKKMMNFKDLTYFVCQVDGLDMYINPNEIESVLFVKE